MSQKKVSQMTCRQWKAHPEKRLHKSCGEGLFLVVQPGNSKAKSWALFYRFGGKHKKLTLGVFLDADESAAEDELQWGGALTLSGARVLAAIAKNDLKQNLDPSLRKQSVKAAAQAAAAEAAAVVASSTEGSFAAIVQKFHDRELKGMREGGEYMRILRRLVLPAWGARQLSDIRKRDVIDLLDGLKDKGLTGGANKAFAVIRRLFNWCVARDLLAISPCMGIEAPAIIVRRDRVLTDNEIRWMWQACEKLAWPFGAAARLLLLTGQRRDEVSQMSWPELNGDLWTIPGARAKNSLSSDVPLSNPALDVIASLPRIGGKADFLFTTTGESAISGWSRFKANLDEAMVEIGRRETGNPNLKIAPWTLHDLRRTCATGLQRLGIRFEVTESVLNHMSGSRAGVAGIYQRYDWKAEKRLALDAWAAEVVRIAEGRPADAGNVTELRRAS